MKQCLQPILQRKVLLDSLASQPIPQIAPMAPHLFIGTGFFPRIISPTECCTNFLKPCPELTLGNEEQKIITWRDTQHWPYAWPTNDFSGSPYRVGISDNVYSTPNIELVSSGIEAAVMMGRNVARLVVQDLKRQASLRFAPEDDLEE